MKILLINGSPKGTSGNTIRLAEAFLDGFCGQAGKTACADGASRCQTDTAAQTSPEIVRLQLDRLNIRPCLGCFSCWNRTPGECCIDDDMRDALTHLIGSDLIIWSFPLYYYSVPGPLKNFIDRQLPTLLPFMDASAESGGHPSRYAIEKKRHVVISTCGFYCAQGNYDGVLTLFDHMLGEGNYETLFCGQGELFRVPELSARTDEYLTYVENAGREYYSGAISPKTRQKLDTLLLQRELFEKLADASWGLSAEDGEAQKEALVFTRQMAALFSPAALTEERLVLEMVYTDISRRYQILLTREGSQVLTEHFTDYTTKIETPYSVWNDIACGNISGEEALMKHLYRVKGDFNLMLHWNDYFSAAQTTADACPQSAGTPSRRTRRGLQDTQTATDMNLLLLPWIVFWVVAAIDGRIGALITIVACALIPLLFFHNRKTIYDSLTTVLVAGLSCLLLSGLPVRIIMPLSYLCFGLMWTVSCLSPVPLTAWYSMNDYGVEHALANPLFIKTNRILTLLWGILYLITPVWTWFLMGTPVSYLTGLINSVFPALMGIFTAWFQKWYPARYARG